MKKVVLCSIFLALLCCTHRSKLAKGSEQVPVSQPSSQPNYSYDKNIIVLYEIFERGGASVSLTATLEQVKKTPEWQPETSEPPISPGKAMMLAINSMREEYPNIENFVARDVEIKHLFHRDLNNRWAYIITFDPIVRDHRLKTINGFLVGVLMNGEIVHQLIDENPKERFW